MKHIATIVAIMLAAFLPLADAQQKKKMPIESTTTQVPIPKIGKTAHFIPRTAMAPKIPLRRAKMMARGAVPPTMLPVDASNNRQVKCPMHGNDQYGDCGIAMAAHTIEILTYGQGKPGWTEYIYQDAPLIQQYLQLSGGDNGMDEEMEVGQHGCFTVGVGGKKDAVAVGALDIDPNDKEMVQYCLDNFYTLQLAWSVPNAFINNFESGQSYLSPMTPNPNNGHYTTISDVTKEGYYTLWTWGGWAQVSQSFVASVQPEYFVVFCPLQFSKTDGRDSKGVHITTRAAAWVAIGGNVIPQAVIASFPPAAPPDDKAPYKLFEGDMKAPVPVGVPLGYQTLQGAETDAKSIASKDQKDVMIHDKSGAMVETVKPGPPPPPPPPTFTITLPAFTIPGQSVTVRGPLGKTYSGSTAPVTVPAQTVTGTINP